MSWGDLNFVDYRCGHSEVIFPITGRTSEIEYHVSQRLRINEKSPRVIGGGKNVTCRHRRCEGTRCTALRTVLCCGLVVPWRQLFLPPWQYMHVCSLVGTRLSVTPCILSLLGSVALSRAGNSQIFPWRSFLPPWSN